MMTTSGISKFLYDFWCLDRALDNSTINSYQSYLHETILLRNIWYQQVVLDNSNMKIYAK